MRILILGGTKFVGRQIAEQAAVAGDEVVLFNRGQTNPEVLPNAERIRGDRTRDEDMTSLAQRQWDCVIDVSGYTRADVRRSANAVRAVTAHYLYISTISVYPQDAETRADESTPIYEVDDDVDDAYPQAYGIRKAQCEQVLGGIFEPQRLAVVRPTVVVGPHDPTDRFTYWVRQIAGGGTVPVASRLQQPVQLIDVRDLADFVLGLVHADGSGTFNACGPQQPLTLGQMLDGIVEATGSGTALLPIPQSILDEHQVNLPLVLPLGGSNDSMFRMSNKKALASGLSLRSLSESVQVTLEWDRERGMPPLAVGPKAEQIAAVMADVSGARAATT